MTFLCLVAKEGGGGRGMQPFSHVFLSKFLCILCVFVLFVSCASACVVWWFLSVFDFLACVVVQRFVLCCTKLRDKNHPV